MSATTSRDSAPAPPPEALKLFIGGREWQCRPTMPVGLAERAARLGFYKLDTIRTNRQRRRVADSYYRKFLSRQVIGSYELLQMLGREPDLWPDAIDQACSLAQMYVNAGLVD